MNTGFIIAVTIAAIFFVFIIGMFVYGYVSAWIAEERIRESYACKIDEIIAENWDI